MSITLSHTFIRLILQKKIKASSKHIFFYPCLLPSLFYDPNNFLEPIHMYINVKIEFIYTLKKINIYRKYFKPRFGLIKVKSWCCVRGNLCLKCVLIELAIPNLR